MACRGTRPLRPSTHHKFKSPHIASITQSVIAAVIIILFAVFTGTNDPASQAYLQLYGLMAVMGVIIILSVQALVSLAILVYYERYHRDEVHWWKDPAGAHPGPDHPGRGGLPAVRQHQLPGQRLQLREVARPHRPGHRVDRVATAFYFKQRKPAKYEQAGRLINEGL